MPPVRQARVVQKNPGSWTNKHGNVTRPIAGLYDLWNPTPPNTAADFKLVAASMQALVRDAIRDGVRLRPLGAGWSVSTAAVTGGCRLVNTKPLNMMSEVRSISPSYAGDRSQLLFVQCGTTVVELNAYLESTRRSLKTSGASNGQTIAGAISTGTHGSAFSAGSMQDFVVGIHLVAGPDKAVWLERSSYPVVNDAFAPAIGAELVSDDRLFDAALVSFGSFGFIHGFLIETEPLYLLQMYRRRMKLDNRLRDAMNTLDFSGLSLPIPGLEPFHFEVVVNPHDIDGGAFVTTMYKHPYRPDYPRPPRDDSRYGPGDDVLAVIGTMTDSISIVVPAVVNGFAGAFYKERNEVWGTHGEIFCATNAVGKATSAEIGVSAENSSKVLDHILAAHAAAGPFPGFISFRFVRRSAALLAFTAFDKTCTVEFPGVLAERSVEFFRAVWRELDLHNIRYTLHWGQENNLTPERVRAMYGPRVDEWSEARERLLTGPARQVFSSEMLERSGLA